MRLAGFYLQAGRTAASFASAEAASQRVTNYPPALLAQGRALVAFARGAEVIAPLRRAAELNSLADVLRANGETEAALKVEANLKPRGEESDPRTLALSLATRGEQAAKAVRLAREEQAERADVHILDALARALAASGDLAAAETAMRAALVEGTKEARLFFHAGAIAVARGQLAAAWAYFERASPAATTLTPSEQARLGSRLQCSATAARAG